MCELPDQDEQALSLLTKKLLSRPPKPRSELKVGKRKEGGSDKRPKHVQLPEGSKG